MIAKSTLIFSMLLSSQVMAQGKIDFLKSVLNAKQEVIKMSDNASCENTLGSLNKTLTNIHPSIFDLNKAKKDGKEIIKQIFSTRLELRKTLKKMSAQGAVSKSCENEFRRAFRIGRFAEEYIAALAGFNKEVDVLKGDEPYFLKSPDFPKDFKVQSGDIFISRGNAYVSAAIARIGEEDGQFSHAAIAYVNPVDKKTYMIEAHIEIGSDVAPIDEKYTQDGKVRVVVFRHKNKALAERAAYEAYKATYEPLKKGQPVLYDFGMVLDDESKLFCSEIPYMAYKRASNGNYLMGAKYRTTFDLKHNTFLRGIGITEKSTLSPTDIELDTDLELVAEWRDLANINKTHRKDAVLAKMYEWMEKEGIKLDVSSKVAFAHFVVLTRKMPLIGNLLKNSIATNVTASIVEQMTTMDLVAEKMLDDLISYEGQFVAKNGRGMTYTEMLSALDSLRKEDEERKIYYDQWKMVNPTVANSEASPMAPEAPRYMQYLVK